MLVLLLALAAEPQTPPQPEPAPVPRPFSRDSVQQAVAEQKGDVQDCYESAMRERGQTGKDAPGGRVLVKWIITPDGLATDVKILRTAVKDDLVTGCIVNAVRSWTFPKPAIPQPVEFPFDLKPVSKKEDAK